MAGKITLLRNIISELRYASPEGHVKNSLMLRYAVDQFRKYKTTDQQLCKAREEVEFMAKTYLCYLKSSRVHKEIQQEYHGRGERTVEETAKMVGFKLPHDPK
ncbi:hypothetical protein NQ317_014356 [Molorchus minor]|uniref:Protein FMC1 homolog n=1 Tax=Molorchus minor TaxID=1323400 RepID=A0ABQ9K6Q0_9CUCU|nr:hypothetical protein NQ317_014356 [Molorchus minor]